MNWDIVQGNWKQFTGRIKEEWGRLTDDELDRIAGQKEQLEGSLQEKYGWTKEEAHQRLDDWLKGQEA